MRRLGRGLLSACVRRCLVKPVLRVPLPSSAALQPALAYRSVHGAAAGAAAVKRAASSTLMHGAVLGALVSSVACAGAADASAPDAMDTDEQPAGSGGGQDEGATPPGDEEGVTGEAGRENAVEVRLRHGPVSALYALLP